MPQNKAAIREGLLTLELLDAVGNDGLKSQRHLAAELGVALGLVNVYMKRCVKKGFVKVQTVPARRYRYYLTPKGAAEKGRLTMSYLSQSLSFFRRARSECVDLLDRIGGSANDAVILAGLCDLTEIAVICAFDRRVKLEGIVDTGSQVKEFAGIPVFQDFSAITFDVRAVLVTDMYNGTAAFEAAVKHFGSRRVFAPPLLALPQSLTSEGLV